MKRRNFLVTPFVARAGLAAADSASSAWVSRRPRLFYDQARIGELRAQIQPGKPLASQWSAILENANGLLRAELIEEATANQGAGDDAGFGRASQQIASMAFTLGIAYHLSGEQRYAEKLRQALLHFGSYHSWHGPGFPRRVPAWHSELNTARFCVAFGVGLDALYSFLSTDDRATISTALREKGILATFQDWLAPDTRIHSLDSMGHNWWAVCVSSAGIAVLSLLGEDKLAPQWLDRVHDALSQWFAFNGSVLLNKVANFDAKGAFYESVNYANYALSEYLRFRLAATNVFPNVKQPDYPPLREACSYFFHTHYPSSTKNLVVNFGDNSISSEHYDTVRLLLENGFGDPAAGWYLSNTKSADSNILNFLARRPVPPAVRPVLPHSILYPGIGWAMLRTSWEKDATLLSVKSGFTWNHAHADAGSFTLYHKGEPLIIDSGTCSYGNPQYPGYYVQSRAHNVILFNGQGEPEDDHVHGAKFPGALHSLIDALGVKYVYADATGPMARWFQRNYRHWLWIDGVIVIFDDLRAHEKGTFQWLLHYEGQAETKNNTVSLSNGRAQADLLFLYPEQLQVKEETGLAEHQPSKTVSYLSFQTGKAADVQKFITVIIPRDAPSAPQVELLSGTDFLGVRIHNGDTVSDVYLNLQADGRRMHLNSNNTISDWETDAYLFAWSRPTSRREDPAAATRFFISYGSYLRRQGRVYFDSLTKADIVWQPGSKQKAIGDSQRISHMTFL
jgi:hypothetical protein